ncbi:hypothetical protein CFIMG_006778RAa [Ceratocystis fimbriata CBS 114723]|uniref:Uncharacterized protein n=2 Tax=Ceratocystis TaxID=5157 RepID=A0A2C5WV31_9PEZI|nr:hypothetical protein CFIMG_006778RAa [Ceratocystis fimbriata CBS 114723]
MLALGLPFRLRPGFLALALFVSGSFAAQALSSEPLDNTVMCVYPMSGHYGVLNRCLFYTCLLIAVVGWKLNWIVLAASTWVFLISAISAVHIWALVTMGSNPDVVDLDILAAWIIIVASLMMWNGMLTFSRMLKNRRARPIITVWALFLLPAPIAYLAGGPKALRKIHAYSKAVEVACYNPKGVLLTSPAQLWRNDSSWNCTYNCFSAEPSLFRDANEVVVIPANIASFLPKYVIAGCFIALAAALFGFYAIMVGHQSAGRYFFDSSSAPLSKFRSPKDPLAAENSPVIPGTIPPERRQQKKTGVAVSDITSKVATTIPLSIAMVLLTVPLVVFTELAFHGYKGSTPLPAHDMLRGVGQWYAWVAFAMVIIVSSFTPIMDYMDKYWF